MTPVFGVDYNNGADGLDFDWATSWTLLDANFSQYYLHISDFNTYGDLRYQLIGDYITDESDPIFLANVANIVFDGNNVSRLTNDSNYQDFDDVVAYAQPIGDYLTSYIDSNYATAGYSFDDYLLTSAYIDSNFETAGYGDLNMDLNYLQIGDNISDLVNDSGFITSYVDTNFETSFSAFDSNMSGTYREYSVDLNTTANVNADNISADNVYADSNVYIGTKGYMYQDGNSIIIGVSS